MKKNLTARTVIIAVTLLLCIYGIIGIPKSKEELMQNFSRNIHLGLDLKGGFGGGQVGYNYQINNFVWGIEGDIAGADISETDTFGPLSVKVSFDTLASLRGRFGVAYGNALFYGTAGAGWGHFKVSASAFGFSASDSVTLSGWTVGAGIEYAFLPNWSAKVEYLHYGFGSENFVGLPTGNLDVDTIKAGINYRF